VLANIVEGIKGAVLSTGNDDGLWLEFEHEEITWFCDILGNTGNQPGLCPELVPFLKHIFGGDAAISRDLGEGYRPR